jgi:hypothetical protein
MKHLLILACVAVMLTGCVFAPYPYGGYGPVYVGPPVAVGFGFGCCGWGGRGWR